MLNACIERIRTCADITCSNTAIIAGIGAASGAIGTAILNAAGYAYPSVKTAAAMGAVGSTIFGTLTGCCLGAASASSTEADRVMTVGYSTVYFNTIAIQTLAGMLGNVLLGGVTTIGKSAALSAVGSSVLAGGIVTAAGIGVICACSFFYCGAHNNTEHTRSNRSQIRNDSPEQRDFAVLPDNPSLIV